jgi:nickel-dependent lactate racemase
MDIRLAYGKTGLYITLPDSICPMVIEPKYIPGLPDPHKTLQDALQNPINSAPLHDLVKSADKVGIVFSDITRPTPNKTTIPRILSELTHAPNRNITLFNALGTHRPNTDIELRALLGDRLANHYRVVQNEASDPSTQVYLGTTSRGHDIWINRELVECDVKILTGFIEPHFFAGFSGGGKAAMPGMAGQQTILKNHDAEMIEDPNATWGITWGNPVWEEMREVALVLGNVFLVNVTLNRDKQITRVFTGELDMAYQKGTDFVRETAMAPVPHPFDIVITTNSGYPLDLNLYQSVKGMSAAAQIVREGGAIIIAVDCWDGVPEHGLYGQLLMEANSPQELLDRIRKPGFLKQDQWQVQLQAQIMLKADIYVRSGNLTDEQIKKALLNPSASIEETLAELLLKYGPQARICVLPEGPQTIPYLQQ